MSYREYRVAVTTEGSAGSASNTGTTEFNVNGEIVMIRLAYHASAPGATTDVTVSEVGGAARTLLTRSNTATSGTFYPLVAAHDTAGAAVTYDGTRPIYVPLSIAGRKVQVSVAQCDALTDAVVMTLIVKE